MFDTDSSFFRLLTSIKIDLSSSNSYKITDYSVVDEFITSSAELAFLF